MANALAVAGPKSKYAARGAKPAGFWAGFWHGNIAGITFVVSLFNKGVSIYETHNNGGWYNFGFLLGVSSLFGSNIKVNVDKSDKSEEPEAEPEDE